MQGLLKLANLPFVGAGVVGSAVGMDKDVMKRLLKADGIPIADFLVFDYGNRDRISFDEVKSRLGLPLFVKRPIWAPRLASARSVTRKA